MRQNSKDFFNLTLQEEKLFRSLRTPAIIQNFLNTLSINFEPDGDTCRSPREVLNAKCAHCLEGALFAAAVLWYHGHPPLLLDLKASKEDFDHVVALFQKNRKWGAISKTNHAVLRYREPIYANVRELALSYFHEYFDDNGKKTLRSFSKPFNLTKFGTGWITSPDDQWDIGATLDDALHTSILPSSHVRQLRTADPIEIQAGMIVEYKPPRK